MRIETERLILRSFTINDAKDMLAYLREIDINEKLGMRKEGLFQELVSFVKDTNGEPIYENTYQYAILKKEWKQG